MAVVVAAPVLAACDTTTATPPATGSGHGTAHTPAATEPARPLKLALKLPGTLPSQALTQGATVPDTSGAGHDGTVQTSPTGGVSLQPISGRTGTTNAVQFLDPCTAGATCPKAIIEVPDSPAFVPGPADFAFGADVMLTNAQTSDGSNVVQKGFSTGGGSQWKLQVDHTAGAPSCIVVGTTADTRYVAWASTSIADGAWHEVRCSRTGETLTILVDGVQRGKAQLPAGLEVRPQGPVRIGGKNLRPTNDQYFGAVSDVYYGTYLP